jgi:hypothetical protein
MKDIRRPPLPRLSEVSGRAMAGAKQLNKGFGFKILPTSLSLVVAQRELLSNSERLKGKWG